MRMGYFSVWFIRKCTLLFVSVEYMRQSIFCWRSLGVEDDYYATPKIQYVTTQQKFTFLDLCSMPKKKHRNRHLRNLWTSCPKIFQMNVAKTLFRIFWKQNKWTSAFCVWVRVCIGVCFVCAWASVSLACWTMWNKGDSELSCASRVPSIPAPRLVWEEAEKGLTLKKNNVATIINCGIFPQIGT